MTLHDSPFPNLGMTSPLLSYPVYNPTCNTSVLSLFLIDLFLFCLYSPSQQSLQGQCAIYTLHLYYAYITTLVFLGFPIDTYNYLTSLQRWFTDNFTCIF